MGYFFYSKLCFNRDLGELHLFVTRVSIRSVLRDNKCICLSIFFWMGYAPLSFTPKILTAYVVGVNYKL